MEKDETKLEDVVKATPEAEKAPAPKRGRKPKVEEAKKPVRYVALSGITYAGRHASPGDVLEGDVPQSAIEWLLDRGYIKKED